MRRLQKISVYISLFLFSGHSLIADMLYDATLLEREGRNKEAFLLYDSWLSDNQDDSRFSEVLFHNSSIIESVEESLNFLFKYEKIINLSSKQQYYLRIAQTYELLFQNKNAALYYKKAAKKTDGNIDYTIYLKYLLINYQLGHIPSMDILNNILLSNLETSTYVDALIFKSEILKYNGETDLAINILQQWEYKKLFPEIQFAIWELYLLDNDFASANRILELMRNDFPDSIELSLMEGSVGKLTRISEFFIKKNVDLTQSYIQVGSFSKPENIQTISHSLDIYNYDYFYIKTNNITKIIVTDYLSSDELLNKLKSHGFDGFKIDYQKLPD